jgi:branched-chain amino acid transport system ATP-binding protein
MLRTTSVITHYGRVRALDGVSLHVEAGEIVCLLGANGAGKTTLLRTISGLNPATRGAVVFLGREITRQPPEAIVRAGLSHVPEGRQLFGPMSVSDNLALGAYPRSRQDKRRHLARDLERIFSLFPVLRERAGQTAATLSGGEQQMLAISRALMASPKLLLLDEPSMGIAPIVTRQIFGAIAALRDRGVTVLLAEQNARAALTIADRGYVLETGRIVAEGTAAELMRDREVQRAYLGKGYREVWED